MPSLALQADAHEEPKRNVSHLSGGKQEAREQSMPKFLGYNMYCDRQ